MPRGNGAKKRRTIRRPVSKAVVRGASRAPNQSIVAAIAEPADRLLAITELVRFAAGDGIPASANYRKAATGADQTCANCSYYSNGDCTMFDGNPTVSPSGVCDEWEAIKSDASITAAAGDLVWDDEAGFMDLMEDLTGLLNGDGWGWRVVDVALTADKAIVCCWSSAGGKVSIPYDDDEYTSDDDGPGYWLVPFKIGDDQEPVLADREQWTQVEEGWVQTALTLNAKARGFAMAACENCDHAYADHLGTQGPCTTSGCDCNSYTAPDAAAARFENGWMNVLGEVSSLRAELSEFQLRFAAGDQDVAPTLPDAHKPNQRKPRTKPGPAAPAPMATVEDPSMIAWSAVLAPEGKLTSDGRAFHPGAISWPRLDDGPLSLMAMTVTSEGGHIGAELAGRIDRIWRDEAAGLIRAEGVFDSSEYGQEIARMVEERVLRGVSVDLAIQSWIRVPREDWFDADGNWDPQEGAAEKEVNPIDAMYADDMISLVLEAEIGMTTVCPFPAFADAQIAVGGSLVAAGGGGDLCWTVTLDSGMVLALTAAVAPCVDCDDQAGQPIVLTAAAAGTVPELPPADWFTNPEFDEPTAVTVTDDGRVFGHAALWDVCHIGLPGQCRTAPHSYSDYAYFHLGEVECEDGTRIACGTVTIDTGHAGLPLDSDRATAHYDNTGTVVAYVVAGEDDHGIWVAGTLNPEASDEKVRGLMGAKLSGDWRGIEGKLELVALLAVNVPGFPVPRAQLVASANGEQEVMALTAAGMVVLESELSEDDVARFRALATLAKAS